jgi:hypothetical protein
MRRDHGARSACNAEALAWLALLQASLVASAIRSLAMLSAGRP